jgi:hypothetical protein
MCKACEKEAAVASKQAFDLTEPRPDPIAPVSSIGMHKGHPIHVGAPFPDKPEMFVYLEDHVRLITRNFIAGARNATKLYTPGMVSPENTRILREILESANDAVIAFDEYIEEMQNHE